MDIQEALKRHDARESFIRTATKRPVDWICPKHGTRDLQYFGPASGATFCLCAACEKYGSSGR